MVSVVPEPIYNFEGKRVWIAGHRGMVGQALLRRLARGRCEVLTVARGEVDLTRQGDVERWMESARPQAIFMAAAKVGGIEANRRSPADFLYDNLAISANVIHAAHACGVEKLVYLGSSCVYPRLAPQPISDDALLTGPLEPTNEWYAVAKIAGIKLCQAYRAQHGRDFVSVMPTNLYGPGDNFDSLTSHVLPALLRKAHEAKLRGDATMTVWGTGAPRREFLHVDDCADALLHVMRHYSDARPLNIGVGDDITIVELARLVARVVGFAGEIVHDTSKPDGTPRKLLDVSRLTALGWRASIPLENGIAEAYRWFVENLGARHG